jgi:hypothetical protein
VALNQLLLGPVVVSAVFAWNLSWSGRLKELPNKWRRDTLPTLRKGWAFWVPASSINFACVRRCVLPCVPAHRLAHASLRCAAHRCICVSVPDLRRPPLRTKSLCRLVPLQHQVLYMSACGIVWTTILSAASAS